MIKNIFNYVKTIFLPPGKKLEEKTRSLAIENVTQFANLTNTIKKGGYVYQDRGRITQDRERFLTDNVNTKIDQNVATNTDNKRAKVLLSSAMILGSALSIKGSSYFFGQYFAWHSYWVIVPFGILLASALISGGIYLNHFSNSFSTSNQTLQYHLFIASYLLVLIIPIANIIEGYDSNYSSFAMILNWIVAIIDICFHTALISMSSVFITASNSIKAIKKLREKEKAQRDADKKVRSFNTQFHDEKSEYINNSLKFVYHYKQLEVLDAKMAREVMFMLSNFQIWMINNKVVQHNVLPYHANVHGQIEAEKVYIFPEEDTVRKMFDQLSLVTITESHDPEYKTKFLLEDETINNNETKITQKIRPITNPDDGTVAQAPYDTIIDDVTPNQNDKSL